MPTNHVRKKVYLSALRLLHLAVRHYIVKPVQSFFSFFLVKCQGSLRCRQTNTRAHPAFRETRRTRPTYIERMPDFGGPSKRNDGVKRLRSAWQGSSPHRADIISAKLVFVLNRNLLMPSCFFANHTTTHVVKRPMRAFIWASAKRFDGLLGQNLQDETVRDVASRKEYCATTQLARAMLLRSNVYTDNRPFEVAIPTGSVEHLLQVRTWPSGTTNKRLNGKSNQRDANERVCEATHSGRHRAHLDGWVV